MTRKHGLPWLRRQRDDNEYFAGWILASWQPEDLRQGEVLADIRLQRAQQLLVFDALGYAQSAALVSADDHDGMSVEEA